MNAFISMEYSVMNIWAWWVFLCKKHSPASSHWTCKVLVRDILSSVCLRLSPFPQLFFVQYMGLCVFSLTISFLMIVKICVLHLIIIIRSLGHSKFYTSYPALSYQILSYQTDSFWSHHLCWSSGNHLCNHSLFNSNKFAAISQFHCQFYWNKYLLNTNTYYRISKVSSVPWLLWFNPCLKWKQ